MRRLIQVAAGCWVEPYSVVAVTAFNGTPELEIKPSCNMVTTQTSVSWTFEDVEAARKWGDRIAGLVNDAKASVP